MDTFINVNTSSLDFFSRLILIIRSETHSSYDDGSIVVWQVPYSFDFCDLLISYNFRTHTLEIMEIEPLANQSSKIDSQILHKLIGAGKLHEAKVLFNDKEL